MAGSAYCKDNMVLSASAGGVEQGDFLMQPSIRLGLGYKEVWLLLWDFYGRDYSSIEERSHMLSLVYKPQLTRMPGGFSLAFGLSLLNEFTRYEPELAEKRQFNSTNLGFFTGIHWNWHFSEKFLANISWDAALYPAGLASIYLVTSRKQFITAGLGVSL